MKVEDPILSVQSLTKTYEKDGLPFYALNDISFELKKGEILGVIGRNGAGKSTLLKVLSKITGVTDGEISYLGTLKSIIEIGTGFHPDLSGRENVKLNAQLLGIPWKEFKSSYNDLVKFSGLEDFMDMPVKHYSSGMYLRLAFSIAFHSKIDILLLDEVLAVGDSSFRRKCYHKIRDLKNAGTSIIFVSHHMEPITSFCDRCLWLDNGRVQVIGQTMDTIEQYLEFTENQQDKIRGTNAYDSVLPTSIDYSKLSTSILSIQSISVYAEGKKPDEEILTSDEIIIEMNCEKLVDQHSFEIIYTVFNINNVRVLTDSYGLRMDYSEPNMKKGKYRIVCRIPSHLLNRGVYSVSMVITQSREYIGEFPAVFRFKVGVSDVDMYGHEISSIIRPKLDWVVDYIDPSLEE